MAAVPTQEYGSVYHQWFKTLLAPEVQITADRNEILVNELVRMTPVVTLTCGAVAAKFTWHWGGDTLTFAGEPEPIQRSFESVGSHEVCLAVTDSNGQTGSSNTIMVRVSAAPTHSRADFDLDGDVDQEDFGHLQGCLTGVGAAQTDPCCQDALLDGDDDVDQNDLAVFQSCFTGANRGTD